MGDIDFVDAYAKAQGIPSRSAVLHEAIRLLRDAELTDAYDKAFAEWSGSEDEALWNTTVGDGLAE